MQVVKLGKPPLTGGVRRYETSPPYLSVCWRGVISQASWGDHHAERHAEAAGLATHPEDDGCRPLRNDRWPSIFGAR